MYQSINTLRQVQLWCAIPLLLVATLTGCRQTATQNNGQRYELKGKIVSFDKAQQQVVISHEAVPELMMDAMTMPFTLKEETAFEVMRAGDHIQATLIIDDGRTWLEHPVITQSAVAGAETTATPPQAGGLSEPQPGATVPDVALINQDGQRLDLQKYRGSPLLITFIYTRCPLPDYCTLMSQNFAEINRALATEPGPQNGAHLLSITLDPAYDTPKVLRSYGAAHTGNYTSEQFERWDFATGKPEEIKRLANFFGLMYEREGDQITHSLRTALIAPDGTIYKLYRRNEWKPADVLNDLREMQKQKS